MRNSKSSSGDSSGMRNIYMMPEFYLKPENMFWERDSYSEAGKEYFRNLVKKYDKIISKRGANLLPNA